jgi:hypothetical protein
LGLGDLDELSSLTGDSEHLSDSDNDLANQTAEVEGRKSKAVKERSRKPRPKVWETVDDVRQLTRNASRVLQSLASVAEREKMAQLIALRDSLSAQSELKEPDPTCLPFLVKRCVHFEGKVVEDKFKHMISLIQLSLWLNQ